MIFATICLIIWVIFLAIAGIIYINPEHPILKYKFNYEKTFNTCIIIFFIFAILWVVFLFFEI